MEITSIKETCIYIADVDSSRHFYEGKLGLEVLAAAPGCHLFLRAGSSVLLCFIAAYTSQQKELPPHGAAGIVHFAFQVEKTHYAAAMQQVKAAGIEILYEQQWANGLLSFYFNDPDNNLLEIVQTGIWD
jgi:catechol 2,3-dioxygenase-like lactoylglutathione lyase family enzyme